MLWTISSVYSPANNLSFHKTEKISAIRRTTGITRGMSDVRNWPGAGIAQMLNQGIPSPTFSLANDERMPQSRQRAGHPLDIGP
jgi:hypothetical protein